MCEMRIVIVLLEYNYKVEGDTAMQRLSFRKEKKKQTHAGRDDDFCCGGGGGV